MDGLVFPRALSGPFDNASPARFSSSRALCEVVIAVISASTVCPVKLPYNLPLSIEIVKRLKKGFIDNAKSAPPIDTKRPPRSQDLGGRNLFGSSGFLSTKKTEKQATTYSPAKRIAVPSALEGLTSGFGMGPGGPPPLFSPASLLYQNWQNFFRFFHFHSSA